MRILRPGLVLPVLIFLYGFAACVGPRDLAVRDAWARPALAGDNSAVYFVIVNPREADTLVGAQTDSAASAMIHQTVLEGDVVRMVMRESVEVPASGKAVFEPGGLHIMLVDLQQDLSPGDQLPLTLTFAAAGEIKLLVPVGEP